MRTGTKVVLNKEQKARLETMVRAKCSQVRDVLRARIVLMVADGMDGRSIARQLKVSENTVSLWRRRFAAKGIDGLKDKPGRGRKRTHGPDKVKAIIEATLHEKPKNATHWSTRSMAEYTGVSHSTVRRIWNAHKLKPHLVHTFKLSNDKRFVEKLRDVVGLYMNPPEHALVLSVDEKTQIQALDRTQPGLPLVKGRCGTMTHDYKRNGTTTLFAALNVLDGKVIGTCTKRHRHQEYLKFLRQIKKAVPKDMDVHLIVDNYATHKHEKVKKWLEKNKRFHVHFIPTSSSWLNLVERFFGELTNKQIRRGVFRSVDELTNVIYEYLENYNEAPKPFVWTKTADEIMEKLAPLYEARSALS